MFFPIAGFVNITSVLVDIGFVAMGGIMIIAALADYFSIRTTLLEREPEDVRQDLDTIIASQLGVSADEMNMLKKLREQEDERRAAEYVQNEIVPRRKREYSFPDLVPNQVECLYDAEKEPVAYRFYNAVLPINKSKRDALFVPTPAVADLVPVSTTIRAVEKIAHAVAQRWPVFLVGNTGVGKTALIRYLAYKTRNNLRRFNLNGQTEKSEFLGHVKSVVNSHGRTYQWQDGILIKAMKEGA